MHTNEPVEDIGSEEDFQLGFSPVETADGQLVRHADDPRAYINTVSEEDAHLGFAACEFAHD